MIVVRDHAVLSEFIRREADCFKWSNQKNTITKNQYIRKMTEQIQNHVESEKSDFVIIKSITNIGLVEAELRLTPSNWVSGTNMILALPPSPKGSVSKTMQKRKQN